MSADLGTRLRGAGIVTREQLTETVALRPLSGAALVRALGRRGVSEDAIVGYFVAEGFGPPVGPDELASADPRLVRRVPSAALVELGALPLREERGRWVVAMIAPTERHAVKEIERLAKVEVVPTVARASELDRTLEALGLSVAGRSSQGVDEPSDEEPTLVELVRRRASEQAPTDSGDRPWRVRAPVEASVERNAAGDVPVPLVRTRTYARTPADGPSAKRGSGSVPFPSVEARVPWPSTRGVDEDGQRTAPLERVSASSESVIVVGPRKPGLPDREPANKADDPATMPEGSWQTPPESSRRPDSGTMTTRLSPRAARALAPLEPSLADVGETLARIRQATDRDDVVRAALEGALPFARSAVFFALRKGLLKGWDGVGAGVSRDSARNLWIPTSTASLFQRVVHSGMAHFGPHGDAIADGLFRAAVGSRGGDLALLPVRVNGRVVALLAADDVRGGPRGHKLLETIVHAVDEAFARLLLAQKRGG